ncbi:hypothetical protein BD779DRAFT_1469201 [Infundibulicybe gibba]|nr:hypothetical protein BD779DRAFT_1469201 [Infundibulicybe gibba]
MLARLLYCLQALVVQDFIHLALATASTPIPTPLIPYMAGYNQSQTEISESHPTEISPPRASRSQSSLFRVPSINVPLPAYDSHRLPRYERYPIHPTSGPWPPDPTMRQVTSSRGVAGDLERGRANRSPRAHMWRIAAVFLGMLLLVGLVIGAGHIPSKHTA